MSVNGDRAAKYEDLFGDATYGDEESSARYTDLFERPHEHGAECAYCPLCATIAIVRRTKPEILEHLAGAARELVLAAGLLIEEAAKIVGAEGPDDSEAADVRTIRPVDFG